MGPEAFDVRAACRVGFILTVVLIVHAHGATVTVAPGDNIAAKAKATAPGDTVAFAPNATYTLPTVKNGAALVLPGGRRYVGNGATLRLSDGLGDPAGAQELVKWNGAAQPTEITGFIFTDAQIHCEGGPGAFDVHHNTFKNGRRGIFLAHQSGHFDNNAFSQLTCEGIYGYPADHNTYNRNSFDYVYEPVHLSARCDDAELCGNVITHATRIAIELQRGMSHLTVSDNYVGQWLPHVEDKIDSHMALSVATGGAAEAPWAGQGHHITIAGNVLLQDGPNQAADLWAKSAIEIMGDEEIQITGNYIYGWGQGILNGATNPGPLTRDNVVVGGALSGKDGARWPIGPLHSTNDRVYKLSDPEAPKPPAKPAATRPG